MLHHSLLLKTRQWQIQSNRAIMIIFLFSVYSVVITFFFFCCCCLILWKCCLFSWLSLLINTPTPCCSCGVALPTEAVIIPVSVVESGEDWVLGEQLSCTVCDYRQVTSPLCSASLFVGFDMLWSRDCIFPCVYMNLLVCFLTDVSSWSWKRCLRAPCRCFCRAKCPRSKWESWAAQVGGSNCYESVYFLGVKVSVMPGTSQVLWNLMGTRDMSHNSLLLHPKSSVC